MEGGRSERIGGDEMMKKFLIYLMAATMIAGPMVARAVTLDDANAAFAAGKYQDSTADYQAVLDQRGYSAAVLFDLGNSYYREGNFPEAILAYKRAQWLAPNDEDIVENLQAAQRQAGLSVGKTPRYTKITGVLSVDGWAWIGCIAWTLLCVSLLVRALLPTLRTLFSTMGFACAVVLPGAIGAIILSGDGLREAVVVDKNPAALISPFPAAQSVFTPIPGDTVRIEESHNDFLRVVDGAGHSGWMANSQLAPVVK
jgi:tetratricopeptide (TPR) repeat protein